jgi:inhibitor of KinA
LANRYSIVPLNETAALVLFGNSIDVNTNESVIALHEALAKNPFDGFIESVPAYSSLAIFYHPTVRFETVKAVLEALAISVESPRLNVSETRQMIEIPVLYDGDDLDFVGERHGLSREQVISIHTASSYRVFMLGFLPGFPYMGTVDDRIATPRRNSPRTVVPAGSIGIAGKQTGIYSQSSPGGWQLLGRTPLKIFDAKRETPCLLTAGDIVKFYSITSTEFENLNEY